MVFAGVTRSMITERVGASIRSEELTVPRISHAIGLARGGNLGTALRNRVAGPMGLPRRLYRRPALPGSWSVRRINFLHAAVPGMVRYLEIGIAYGDTLDSVTLPSRTGVDPAPKFDLNRLPAGCRVEAVTSDAFFRSNRSRFDIVFLDGLHTYRQTYRDLINALRVCSRGPVLVDDVVPCDETSAIPDLEASLAERRRQGLPGTPWHGDVYRMMVCVIENHPELRWRTLVTGGNPQTFVWKEDPEAPSSSVGDEVLAKYESATFGRVFAEGIPEEFHPSSEREALTDVVDAISPRFPGSGRNAS